MPADDTTDKIRTLLRKYVQNQGLTPEQAADRIYARFKKADFFAYIRPLLIRDAEQWVRAETRKIEDLVFDHIEDSEDPAVALRKFSEETFPAGPGIRVLWLDATAEQHEYRAQMLEGMARSTLKTAERHRRAAAMIRAAGGTCLRDLGEAA